MRKTVIAGNWKMNKTLTEAVQFVEEVSNQLTSSNQVEAIICAPFPHLSTLVEKTKNTPLQISAQNMHDEENGAYTGEVSPLMLQDIGVGHVIIGHSERRQYFAETDERVQKKVEAAIKHNITPIVCVGETLTQREANETKAVVTSQVEKAMEGLAAEEVQELIIAYEPIWAIGTGKTATSEEANEVCRYIRQTIEEKVSKAVADNIIIQYGGSVKPSNVDELLAQPDIDGALVGGASLDVPSFIALVEAGKHA